MERWAWFQSKLLDFDVLREEGKPTHGVFHQDPRQMRQKKRFFSKKEEKEKNVLEWIIRLENLPTVSSEDFHLRFPKVITGRM